MAIFINTLMQNLREYPDIGEYKVVDISNYEVRFFKKSFPKLHYKLGLDEFYKRIFKKYMDTAEPNPGTGLIVSSSSSTNNA